MSDIGTETLSISEHNVQYNAIVSLPTEYSSNLLRDVRMSECTPEYRLTEEVDMF